MSETPCGCAVLETHERNGYGGERINILSVRHCPLHRNAARMRELLREVAEHSAWRATVNGGDTLHVKFYARMTALLTETEPKP